MNNPSNNQNPWPPGPMRSWAPYYNAPDQQQLGQQGPPPPGPFYHIPAEYYQPPVPYAMPPPSDDQASRPPASGPVNTQPPPEAYGCPPPQFFQPFDPWQQGGLYPIGSYAGSSYGAPPRGPGGGTQQAWYSPDPYYGGPYQQQPQPPRWQQPWPSYWRAPAPPSTAPTPGTNTSTAPSQAPSIPAIACQVEKAQESSIISAQPRPSMTAPRKTADTDGGPTGPKQFRTIGNESSFLQGVASSETGKKSTGPEVGSGFSMMASGGGDDQNNKASTSKTDTLTQFNSEQYEALSKMYEQDKFPAVASRRELAEKIGLTFRQVSTWFTARRRKDKPQTEGTSDLTAEQTNALQDVLRVNPVPSVAQRQELANKLGLTFSRISIWFGSRRGRVQRDDNAFSTIIQSLGDPEIEKSSDGPPSQQNQQTDNSRDSVSTGTSSQPASVLAAAIAESQGVVGVQADGFTVDNFEDFTQQQIAALTESYLEQKYPTMESRVELGEKIGIPVARVTAWFVARRAKERPQTVRRRRPELTKEQVEALQEALKTNPTPSLLERQELANRLGLTFARVSGWFGTQRQVPIVMHKTD